MREEFVKNHVKLFRSVGLKQCANCDDNESLELHHIVPLAAGGMNKITNLTILCAECHARTHPNVPITGRRSPIETREKLTYDNFLRWRTVDLMTYEEIRELTGASYSTVALYCRKFGLGADNGIRNKGKKTAIDKIINYFANMQKGEKVKQSTIYRELDMHRNTFGKLAKMLKFKEAMEKYGITNEKTFYIKGVK